ncbi:VP1 [Gokushovirinae sp.]|nr:VP1 [Gokushovirinae sp.]
MNRNIEAHFSRVPTVNHPRSTFDRSYSHSTSFDFGKCIPLAVEEVLPGDTVTMETNKIVRLQTLLAPTLTNMYMDTYWFFVPNRIIWDKWKQFMGENTESAWIPTTEPPFPVLASPTGGFSKGSIADYMGIPVGVEWKASDPIAPSSLPFAAYAMIWNDFFRDQNIDDPVLVTTNPAAQRTGSNGSGLTDAELGGMPLPANKFHDIFTSCLPQPQKGPSVTVPATGSLPVMAGGFHGFAATSVDGSNLTVPLILSNNVLGSYYYSHIANLESKQFGTRKGDLTTFGINFPDDRSHPNLNVPYLKQSAGVVPLAPSNLWARSGPYFTDSSFGVDVNALRLSIATQQYYEALARSGSRLEEQISTFFGVTNPDARVQHPEYLGGNRIQINVHEVTNTAQSETDFLGDIGAQSVTADSHSDFTKSFTEHGILMCIGVARYDHIYSQGMPKMFTRHSKFDFYNPVFANIGEQPIYSFELYANDANSKSGRIFGYNEAWVHYRTAQNRVSGELRPSGEGNLTHWTAADNYASLPTLSTEWLKEDTGNIDRTLAVSHTVANQIFGDFYFNCKWTRCMPMYSVPGQFGSF